MTLKIKGIKFDSAGKALQHINASGRGEAISIGGKVLVVEKAEAHRIEMMNVFFAYLGWCQMPDGTRRIVTIPVND